MLCLVMPTFMPVEIYVLTMRIVTIRSILGCRLRVSGGGVTLGIWFWKVSVDERSRLKPALAVIGNSAAKSYSILTMDLLRWE